MAFNLLHRDRAAHTGTEASPLPAAGRYEIDPTHSTIEFVVRHLVAAKVRGRFGGFSGAIDITDTAETSSVAVEIDLSSVDTGVADRDEHLRSADFFDVANHPTATFRSTGVRHVEGDHYEVTGDLTIHGVTRPVTLELEYAGTVTDPWGGERAVFSAATELDREDFGLTWNQTLETGGVLVGKTARIEIEVEAVRAQS